MAMPAPTSANQRQAARFGVSFATHPGAWAGSPWSGRAERFRPVSLARAVDLLAPARASGPEASAHHEARRGALRTLIANGADLDDPHLRTLASPDDQLTRVHSHATAARSRTA